MIRRYSAAGSESATRRSRTIPTRTISRSSRTTLTTINSYGPAHAFGWERGDARRAVFRRRRPRYSEQRNHHERRSEPGVRGDQPRFPRAVCRKLEPVAFSVHYRWIGTRCGVRGESRCRAAGELQPERGDGPGAGRVAVSRCMRHSNAPRAPTTGIRASARLQLDAGEDRPAVLGRADDYVRIYLG